VLAQLLLIKVQQLATSLAIYIVSFTANPIAALSVNY